MNKSRREIENKYNRSEKGKASRKRKYYKKRLIADVFKRKPCKDCGGKYPPYVMDFHHRDETKKVFSIGTGINYFGLWKFLAEIGKCDVICANCHRVRTHEKKYLKAR